MCHGGVWGYVYTAYTIYEALECKPVRVAPAVKIMWERGVAILLDCPRETHALPSGEALIILYTLFCICQL